MITVRYGSHKRGDRYIDAIEELQRTLCSRGYDVTVNGRFNADTRHRVEQFQLAHGLEDDGIVGPKTWAALRAEPEEELDGDDRREELLEQAVAAAQQTGDPRGLVAVEEALTWLGAREEPKGSNAGPLVSQLTHGYAAYWGISGSDARAWCAMAVSQWIRAGLDVKEWSETPMKRFFGGTEQYRKWARKHGVLLPATAAGISPGSVMVMGRGGSGSDPARSIRAGHTGLVIRDLGDSVLTIDGNVSDMVKTNTRPKSKVIGFIPWWLA